ncbi:oxysterol-binding protein-related protein 1 isoform X2 [Nematostella vectensis]|uniref:oxysterol-binding protein-related protein 1 isoform X2 n=1 Tax=Nematostella vectensis TaxID=45351 RepID=UPI0020770D28|nr:oxysterol-binding protein-related protein 1 isoform X2 [Nematostella vectensis]
MSASKKSDREEKLLQAARRGELQTVNGLLKDKSGSPSGIDVNCRGKSKANNGWTPVLLASYFGHKDVVEILIKAGADINAQNGMGYTALHLASFTGRTAVVLLLLENNADVTIINGEGKTPSQVANKDEIKQLILAAEKSHQLALQEQLLTAARDGNTNEIKRLVSLPDPPDINCRDSMGNTPLHCAAYRGHKEVAVTLLQNASDTSLKNNSGQTALQLTRDSRMKKLLDVQPLQTINKIVPRHEGILLKRSRFFGVKKYWVVLERGVLSYFHKRADAASGHKRQGFKYLDHAKFSVPKEEKHKIKIQYSDNTVHIWSVSPNDPAPQVQRQRWLNSLHEHCAYSTHYTTQPTLLVDEYDQNFLPLGDIQTSIKEAQAHQQSLEQQVSAASKLISNFDSTSSKGGHLSLLNIKTALDEIVLSSKEMCAVLGHCINVLAQQEEVRSHHMEEEVEKRRVLEDALHVLATEHHALECSIGINEMLHTSKLSLVSDSDEFFDAVSDIACSLPDEMPSDSDEESEVYVPADITDPASDQESTTTLRKCDSGQNLNRSLPPGLTRSSSDTTLPRREPSNLVVEGLQKSKSESKDMEREYEERGRKMSEKQENVEENGAEASVPRHRTRLPTHMLSRNEFSVWTVLKQCIGKDLSRITMPVIFNEPLTFLQRITEYMEYSELLHTAASQDDPTRRLQYVAAFAISATSSNLDRVGKPFNPLLGETYELVRPGFRLVAEQVSHHPPITALQCESDDFIFHVTVQPKLKFWGKGVEVQPKGMVTLKFPKHNEVYTWNNVNSCVHNIIVGQLWIEQYGQIEISSLSSGDRATIHFKPAGWFGKELNKVEATIHCAQDKKKRYTLKGDWTDKITCYRSETHVTRKQSKRGKQDFEIASTSSSETSLELHSPVTLWTCSHRPPHSKEMYNFTSFAMQLNELLPRDKETLPPTDSRLRPDCRALENGDLDRATAEKIRLEEKQRAARRERQKSDQEWAPRWFKEEMNPYTGQMDWLYSGGYWDRDWQECPDIF